MRSLVLREFGDLVVQETPDPIPGTDEVIVATEATGICGSDLHGYTGANGRRRRGQVMGHESSGRIHALGDGVKGWRVGAAVTWCPLVVPEGADEYTGREQHCPDAYVIGVKPERPAAFADLVAVPAANLVPWPAGTDLALGALVEPLAVGLHAVRRGLNPGVRSAFVAGGGPIGQSVVLALHAEGVEEIYVSELDAARREVVESLGAISLDAAADPIGTTMRLRGGPVDLAIDAVGVSSTLEACLSVTPPGGSVVILGMASPELTFASSGVTAAERCLVGSYAYSHADFRDAAAILSARPELASRLVSGKVDLSHAPIMFAQMASGELPAGKILVTMGPATRGNESR